jgi:hypothetical protein
MLRLIPAFHPVNVFAMPNNWHHIVIRGSAALFLWLTPALAQGVEHHLERHAGLGETVKLRGHVNYRPCGNVIATAIVVNVAPTHGALAVRDEIVRSIDPDLGNGDKCKGNSGQGKVVYYTRTSLGEDRFRYTSSSMNGDVRIDVTVN